MTIYVDIDNTICSQHTGAYEKSEPWHYNIRKINKLFDEGHYIKYWTARGTACWSPPRTRSAASCGQSGESLFDLAQTVLDGAQPVRDRSDTEWGHS